MSKGNKGFAEAAVQMVESDPTLEADSGDKIMASRSSSLHRLATGKAVTDRTEWVDPYRCRPWRLHNRDLAKLNEHNCADLIEAFKSAGKQRLPAIVRRLRDDPDHDFEIIAGVRRWWTTKWLREHNHPEFDYLVTIQTMTDEEAFRVADLENRSRRDISPLERAQDYLRAIEEFYDRSQDTMAERLNVSKSWLSRILDVGRLPIEVRDAFPDSHEISVEMAKKIAPLAKNPDSLPRLLEVAGEIIEERESGLEIDAAAVARRLAAACAPLRKNKETSSGEIAGADGVPMLRFRRTDRGGGLELKILPRSGATNQEILRAIDQLLKGRAK